MIDLSFFWRGIDEKAGAGRDTVPAHVLFFVGLVSLFACFGAAGTGVMPAQWPFIF